MLALTSLQRISNLSIPLFPVMRKNQEVEWFPLKSTKNKAYFGPAKLSKLVKSSFKAEENSLTQILNDTNFDLVHESFDNLVAVLRNARLPVTNVTPAAVAQYLKQIWAPKQNLPKLVGTTDLLNEDSLEKILSYCLEDKSLILRGLPLLLTTDSYLRAFDQSVYKTKFEALASNCRHLFLHTAIKHLDLKDQVRPFLLEDLIRSGGYETRSSQWIVLFWQFLEEQMLIYKLKAETVTAKIPNWEVLPVQRSVESQIQKAFFKLEEAKSVFLGSTGLIQEKFFSVLKKIECWVLDSEFISSNIEFSSQFVASAEDRDELSHVLSRADVNFARLEMSDHIVILSYFEQSSRDLSNESVSCIMDLPLYETIRGNHISLTGLDGSVRILKASLPFEEIELWNDCQEITFLKSQPKAVALYERLGLKEISELEVYSTYILDKLPLMPDIALLTHLEFLHQKLENEKYQRRPLHSLRNRVVRHLRSMALIGPKGHRKLASEFYLHTVEFFQKIFPEEKLLPKAYRDRSLQEFCKVIGLQCEVKSHMFLQAATNLERNSKATTEVADLAKYLVSFLSQHCQESKWDQDFFSQLSTIKFIPAYNVPDDLDNLHHQYLDSELISVKGSLPESARHLVWTACNLLPSWASYLTGNLGISLQPPLKIVLEHCRILCTDLAKRKSSETTKEENSEAMCQLLTAVMTDIYKFLKIHTNEIESQMATVPCILVEEGKKLVLPRQGTVNMPKDNLRPHLYKLPLELAEFHTLFCAMGSMDQPTLQQFAFVMNSINEASQGRELNPEEKRLAWDAMHYFFSTVNENPSPSSIEDVFSRIDQVYLLTKNGKLEISSCLLFNDCPAFSGRVDGFNCESVETLQLEIQLLEALPQRLKPKFLSEIIVEILDQNANEKCDPFEPLCKLKNHFQTFLADPDFHQGMKRLAKHFCFKSGIKFNDKIMSEKLLAIGSLSIDCRPQLVTLLHNIKTQQVLPESRESRSLFVDQNGSVNLQHESDNRFKVTEILTTLISKILSDYLKPELAASKIVQSILNLEKPSMIEKTLNEENILKGPSQIHKVLEKPGDLIDAMFINFLVQDLAHYFKEGELVGYLQGETTYILTRVICKEGSNNVGLVYDFGQKYKVDIGQNVPVIVGAIDLFKFVDGKVPNKSTQAESRSQAQPFHVVPSHTNESSDRTCNVSDLFYANFFFSFFINLWHIVLSG